jgi:hypothetical protein
VSAKRRARLDEPHSTQEPARRESDTAQYRPLAPGQLDRLATMLDERIDKRGEGKPVVLALSEALDLLHALRNCVPRTLTATEIRTERATKRARVAEFYLERKVEYKSAGERAFAKLAMNDTLEVFPGLTDKIVNHHVATYLRNKSR